MVLVVVAADNNGTNGASSTGSVSDSKSNTWSTVRTQNYDPGVAAAGVTLTMFSTVVTTALTTSDTVTVTFSPDTTSKAMLAWKVVAPSGYKPSLVAADGSGITNTSQNRALTIAVGNTVFGAQGFATNATVTGDTDTFRGAWSSVYSAIADTGTASTSMSLISQSKNPTGTSSSQQNFTGSVASSTQIATMVVEFTEVVATITCTATGDGTGTSSTTTILIAKRTALSIAESDSTAETKVTQLRLGALSDFDFPYYTGGRFYLGAPIHVRSATGEGTGTETATRNVIYVRTATGDGTGTSNNAIVVGKLRTGYGSGGATAGDTAIGNIVPVRTATGSGVGTMDSTGLHIAPRTASASGVGTATTISIHVVIRTSTGTGEGTATTSSYITAIRTSSGSGEGTSTTVGARALFRTATGLGEGTSTGNWDKSHIFRVPITEGYPFAVRLSEESPDRLFAHMPQGTRAKNLYRLSSGTYTTTDPRRPELITRTYFGGHDNFLTDAEITELTAAGYGSSIT